MLAKLLKDASTLFFQLMTSIQVSLNESKLIIGERRVSFLKSEKKSSKN